MPSTLSVRVDAQVNDFSRNLDQAGRRWEKFGRDLNQGSRALTQSFGMTSSALGGLARSFDVAGNAAGIFAGIDGLAGIASSLAVGGPVLAGITALTVGLTLVATNAERSKKELENFKQLLDQSDFNRLEGMTRGLQEMYNRVSAPVQKTKTELEGVFAGPLGKLLVSFIPSLRKAQGVVADLGQEMAMTGKKFNELAPEEARKRVKALADEMERLKRIAHEREERDRALIKAYEPPAFRLLLPGRDKAEMMDTFGGRDAPAKLSEDIQDFSRELRDSLRDQIHDLGERLRHVDGTLESGFQNLAPQLASILGTLLGGLFAGSGKGAQIGAGLGGAFGSGLGAGVAGKFGKGIGASIAGAVFPVIGGAIGGLLGGAFGGLFGGHKKKVDENAAAFERLNRTIEKVNASISNLPTGYRLDRARFRAAEPGLPPIPPSGPVGPVEPPPGGGPEPIDPTIPRISIGTINLPGVANAAQFIRELSRMAEQMTARGGTTGFSTALIRVT